MIRVGPRAGPALPARLTGRAGRHRNRAELAGYNRPEVLDSIRTQFGQRMEADDIADAIIYIVTRPRHVAVNEVLIRPTEQER